MVAEKPSLAASIASILSNNQAHKRINKICPSCPIYEFQQVFPVTKETVLFKMTSVCGHVMGIDFSSKYNNWDGTDPRELFTAPVHKKEANPRMHMVDFLNSEGRGIDYIVLWLDCDKEGENICFEVLDAVGVSYSHHGNNVFRAKFSAITPKDIGLSFERLIQPNQDEARSVDARMELDLRIGCAFTRLQTRYFHQKYGDLESALISYGPCQTPTLSFCVQRLDEILSFSPRSYWQLRLVVTAAGKQLVASWSRGRMFEKHQVDELFKKTRSHPKAAVTSVSRKEAVRTRPVALNSVEMLRRASEKLKMSPHHTMQVAERLYTQGYISYPRTETTHYPYNYCIIDVIKEHVSSKHWGDIASGLIRNGCEKPREGHDAGDHPPITPTRLANEADLWDQSSWRLYEMVVRNFLASVSFDCLSMDTTVVFELGTENFSVTGKQYVRAGFFPVLYGLNQLEDESIPEFKVGELYPFMLSVTEGQTRPPDYLSESELISLMEKHGIGTDASIPVHINNICTRNYVKVDASSRRLFPTDLGVSLIHGYRMIDQELCQPTTRAQIERELGLIAKGQAEYRDIVSNATRMFLQKYDYFVENLCKMDELFEVCFTALSDTGKPFTRCGKCKRFMKLIISRPYRLHCSICKETYSLPQNECSFQPSEKICPIDNFELVCHLLNGKKGHFFYLCPYCYNYPPFQANGQTENTAALGATARGGGASGGRTMKNMLCAQCPNSSCEESLESNTVAACNECDDGFLLLQQTNQRKFKVQCNECFVVINFKQKVEKVKFIDGEFCVDCGTAHLSVSFKKESGFAKFKGCVFCGEEMKEHGDFYVSDRDSRGLSSRGGRRGGRGRGRGRGRGGGRGRGRGGRGRT